MRKERLYTIHKWSFVQLRIESILPSYCFPRVWPPNDIVSSLAGHCHPSFLLRGRQINDTGITLEPKEKRSVVI
jgi:hypothetical protein